MRTSTEYSTKDTIEKGFEESAHLSSAALPGGEPPRSFAEARNDGMLTVWTVSPALRVVLTGSHPSFQKASGMWISRPWERLRRSCAEHPVEYMEFLRRLSVDL